MLNLIFNFFILIISFYFLIKSSDYLISSSSILGERAGFSKFIIGLTLVAIGTSLPELFTSIIAIYSSKNSVAFIFGTVIGSNISNILLIFGILLLFSKKFKVDLKTIDIFFLLLSTLSLLFVIYIGSLTLIYGITYLLLFIIYLLVTIKFSSKKKFINEVEEVEETSISYYSNYFLIIIFLLSLIGLTISAKTIVYSIENLGKIFGIPISILTLTTVAFATSLPEMVVTIQSAKKKEFSLAVGNIIGSNISNIFLIVGISGILKQLIIKTSNYLMSIYFLLFTTLIFIFFLFKSDVKKYHSFIFFGFYLIYLYFIF